MSRLVLEGVCKRYGDQIALDNIQLKLDGGIIALLGANGSGKTTLLRLLATLDQPDVGVIQWRGQDYRGSLSHLRRHIGYLPQALELPHHLTAHRLLCYLAQMRNSHCAAVDEWVSKLALEQIAHKRIGQLSGGELRRLGIAQAFLGQPELLLLDELSSGLDVIERQRVYRLLPNDGRLTLFSTHIPEEAERVAQTLIVLHQGQLVFSGTIAELKAMVGTCYEITVLPEEAQKFLQQAKVSRILHQDGCVTLRVVEPHFTGNAARPAEPSLEDAYLFLLSRLAE
jgi:ABC-type multidrug transport system ATPase subunit